MRIPPPTGPYRPSLSLLVDDGPTCTGSRSCHNEASENPHPCPFRQDVNNDSATQCNCCPSCTHECAMDV